MDLIYRLTDAQGRVLGERTTVEEAKGLAPADTVWRWTEAGFPGDCNGKHGDHTYKVRLFGRPDVPRQTHQLPDRAVNPHADHHRRPGVNAV